jgi:hypothetical protein
VLSPQHSTVPPDRSAQAEAWPVERAVTLRHTPETHAAGQVVPHLPQLFGSEDVSTHAPPHVVAQVAESDALTSEAPSTVEASPSGCSIASDDGGPSFVPPPSVGPPLFELEQAAQGPTITASAPLNHLLSKTHLHLVATSLAHILANTAAVLCG